MISYSFFFRRSFKTGSNSSSLRMKLFFVIRIFFTESSWSKTLMILSACFYLSRCLIMSSKSFTIQLVLYFNFSISNLVAAQSVTRAEIESFLALFIVQNKFKYFYPVYLNGSYLVESLNS
jgi:hypothetical protein